MFRRSELLTRHREGYRSALYLDSRGLLTGGWGHCFTPGDTLTGSIWELIFRDDFQSAIHTAQLLGPAALSEVRFAVLTDMAFNMGYVRLRGFRNMLACLKKEDFIGAAAEIRDSDYARASDTGLRAEKNARMMQLNLWNDEELIALRGADDD